MEQWEKLDFTDGHYSVSNYGNVKNNKTGRILKPCLKKNGYLQIQIGKKWFLIHRLLACAFVENPLNLKYVNHIDEIKTNNRANNLEWCTAKYNVNYGKGSQARCHEVFQIAPDGSIIKKWNSLKSASQALGIKYQGISRVCHGKRATCGGYKWEYAS